MGAINCAYSAGGENGKHLLENGRRVAALTKTPTSKQQGSLGSIQVQVLSGGQTSNNI
jgi:hypothetical protein